MDSAALKLVRLLLVVACAILLWTAAGCFADGESKAKQDRTKSDDANVLEIVLSDLLARPHSPVESIRSPQDAKEPATPQLLFSTEPPAGKIEGGEVFPRGGGGALAEDFANEWEHLSAREQAGAKVAADDLARRARNKDGFKTFVPKNKRITMFTKEAEAKQREIDARTKGFGGLGPQVFRAFAPGYSADRRVAVVFLSFGWSIHSAQAIYILVRRDDHWSVVVRNLVFFL
ncbi:MAG TPA: hypothetical protein VFG04_08855 [Planctomycetaceae bacterium]|jgi:hypothetical protein|nr:hypothetical protein [Planctomycetaceae bacterium]